MLSLKQLKRISEKKKKIVFGYAHDLEKQLNVQNIPFVILYACLAFSDDEEYFITWTHKEAVKVTNNNKTISHCSYYNHYKRYPYGTYINFSGYQRINFNERTIATWTMKIEHGHDRRDRRYVSEIWIGLKDENGKNIIKLCSDGRIDSIIGNSRRMRGRETRWFTKGDIVRFILNLKDKTVDIKINHRVKYQIGQFTCFDIKRNYKFTFYAQMHASVGGKLTLIDFQTI